MRRPPVVAALAIVLGIVTMLLLPSSWVFMPVHRTDDGREPGVRWACAMMDYVSETRGNGICPVCGMKLGRITAGALNAEQRRRMELETTTVTAGPATMTVRAYGAARYDQRTRQLVIPRIAGRVVKRHPGALHEGIVVTAGQPLVDIYSPQVFASQAELRAALAAKNDQLLAAVRERFARWNLTDVADRIVAGGPPVDTVTIASPFAGLVLRAQDDDDDDGMGLPEVGVEIPADRPLLALVAPDTFMVVIHVPEQQARFLRIGQKADIASDDAGELPDIEARIDWLAPALSLETRTREVHLHLRDLHGRLFAGSLVSARIRAVLGKDFLPADAADPGSWGRFILVPKSAVLSTGVRHVAWRRVAVDGKTGDHRFEIAPLALGPRLEDADGDDRYIVRSGLAEGDVVATQGAFLVDSQAQLAGAASLLFPDGAPSTAPAHQH